MAGDNEKQPPIFIYLDDKFSQVYKRFKELDDKMAQMQLSIGILESKEKPSTPCRELIMTLASKCELECENAKADIQGIAKIAHNRVKYGLFWIIVGACFVFTTWSFVYTRSVENRLNELRMMDRKFEDARSKE